MDKLSKLLPGVIARQPNNRQIAELRIHLALRDLLGPDLGSSCEEVRLNGGILTVGISNPALAHQLRLDAPSLLEQLNRLPLRRRLRELRVRTGRGPLRS
ncbi:MAG TPA: DUF721 domain-containing protein [Candidatus Dormibacteraeota bacterium]